MRKEFLLFDVDNTLLDFSTSEKKALSECFNYFNLPFNDNIYYYYVNLNQKLWSDYEKGKIKQKEIFLNRFSNTLEKFSLQGSGSDLEKRYEMTLSNHYDLIKDAYSVIEKLNTSHKLYVVSNGRINVQHSRLKQSKLDKFFTGIFISEEIGHKKPDTEFFTYCFKNIPNFNINNAIIIGDSLNSDIQGANSVGLNSCWFNPNSLKNTTKFKPTITIHQLEELLHLLS